ncbi:hypothetical protein ACFSKL_12475 [Belliella marina]|uniref:Secreted protein n=1 Tax=Belliella marina TaxID=1644146 RepID=A0ABW4VS40_9BACT
MKTKVKITILSLMCVGFLFVSQIKHSIADGGFLKMHICQVTNEEGQLIMVGNTCVSCGSQCESNPCDKGGGDASIE